MKTIIIYFTLFIPATLISSPQSVTDKTGERISIGNIVDRDGYLNYNRGIQGSVEMKGWEMFAGPEGEPRFRRVAGYEPDAGEDSCWDERFHTGGLNGAAAVIAVDGGDLYVGGWFTTAGNIIANHIAKWDGSRWSALGTGANDVVHAIAIDDEYVYIGGWFTEAGGNVVNHIAKWDGNAWSSLGEGIGGSVYTIAVKENEVYAGGWFLNAGGVKADNIAKWNGSEWSSLGGGVDGGVLSIAVSGNDIYAGGWFATAGGVRTNYIAKWDGSGWSALENGMDAGVYAVTIDGGNIYAGGLFTNAGNAYAPYTARWNGSNWSAMGSGMNDGVYEMYAAGGLIYAGGWFTRAGSTGANHIAVWNGSGWSALGEGADDDVMTISVNGDEIYAGGWFKNAGGADIGYIAKWKSGVWSPLGNGTGGFGLNGSVTAMAISGNDIYVGGWFTKAGSVNANYIAKWDGTEWQALGSGVDDGVQTIAVSGDIVYAGGWFTTAGGISANYIAKWDGAKWSALGTGTDDAVYALAVSGRYIYAGGIFTNAGGINTNYFARWSGANWDGWGEGLNGGVYAITPVGNEIYVGGDFTRVGGITANYIAKWSGTGWSALGDGVGGGVRAIAVGEADIYVGGWFTSAGGAGANHIAVWDGSKWSSLGNGLNSDVFAIAPLGDDLYAGGWFTSEDGSNTNYIAKWDGKEWTPLGSGMDYDVYAIVAGENDLYAGGSFSVAGNRVSQFFARWVRPPGFLLNKTVHHFNYVPVGAIQTDSIFVSNTGGTSLTIDSVYSDNSEFTVAPGYGIILPSAHLKFYISFGPVSAGAKSGNIVFLHNADSSPDTVEADNRIASDIGKGWNLVSVPVIMGDYRREAIFPFSDSKAFVFKDMYVEVDTLRNGEGYWLRFDSSESVIFPDTLIVRDTFEVSTGWNMIGSLSGNVSSSHIGTTGPDIISEIFGYDKGYFIADVLVPGRGYWVKTDAAGALILSVMTDLNEERNREETPALPAEINSIVIEDFNGAGQKLFFGVDPTGGILSSMSELPPRPPGAIFDARFASSRMFQDVSEGRSVDIPILLASAVFPVTISWDVRDLNLNAELKWDGGRVRLAGRDKCVISVHSERLSLSVKSAAEAPGGFYLGQNYPNPFNPRTTICYNLPSGSHVTLKVYNLLGQLMGTLVDEIQEAGFKRVEFSAENSAPGPSDGSAKTFSSGVYFYRLLAGLFSETKKFILLR